MFWQDFVHLTKMEFFLKYWWLYLIIWSLVAPCIYISYKSELKRINDKYDKLENNLKDIK